VAETIQESEMNPEKKYFEIDPLGQEESGLWKFVASPMFVVSFALFLAALSVGLTPLVSTKPVLRDLMLNLVQNQKIYCYNLGYVVFAAILYGLGGYGLLTLGQVAVYAGMGFFAYLLLKSALPGEKITPVVGACLVLVYPENWLNIHRIVETNFSILLCLVFIYFLLPRVQLKMTMASSAVFGMVCAWMLLTRTNLVMVMPLAAPWALKSAKNTAMAAVMGLAVLTLVPGWATGTFYPTPGEGPWSFFGGANPSTKESLLKYLNGEPLSMNRLQSMGVDTSKISIENAYNPDKELKSTLNHAAMAWIGAHPFEYLELIPIKFWTLVRPDYRNPSRLVGWKASLYFCVQTFLAFIFPLWLVLKLISKDGFRGPLGVAPFAVLFCVPFLLTESDPRYIQPMDVFFLLEMVIYGFRRFEKLKRGDDFGRV
jgi:hypothetical protein